MTARRAGGMADGPRLRVGQAGGMENVGRLGVRQAEGMPDGPRLGVGRGGGMENAGRLGAERGGGMGYVPHVCRSNLRILMRCPSLLDHTPLEGSP